MTVAAIVVVRRDWPVDRELPPEGLLAAALALRGRVGTVADAAGGYVVGGDGEAITAVLPEPAAALTLVLDLAAEMNVVAGLGWGDVVVDERGCVYAVEASRVRRLAWAGDSHSLWCTAAFLREVELPSGVGVHRAPAHVCARAGGEAHHLCDYR